VQRLSASFVLGYHGCQRAIAEHVLGGDAFKVSDNEFDWLGPGVYFWEANPQRGLTFAREQAVRKGNPASDATVVGAVIDLGLCLDLTTSIGIGAVKEAHRNFTAYVAKRGIPTPKNSTDLLRRNLDCAVIKRLHEIIEDAGGEPLQTVRGVFIEGEPLYRDAGIYEKTHIQIAVRDQSCIKGVFRVPRSHLH
jgi:hypothetical protein